MENEDDFKQLGYWLSWPMGLVAYFVMPAGPWYRQMIAGVLLVTAADLRSRYLSVPGR